VCANKEHSGQDFNHFTIHHSDYTSGDNSSKSLKKSLLHCASYGTTDLPLELTYTRRNKCKLI